jgi:CRISPR/Cas system-associated endoribonuclease Cas2
MKKLALKAKIKDLETDLIHMRCQNSVLEKRLKEHRQEYEAGRGRNIEIWQKHELVRVRCQNSVLEKRLKEQHQECEEVRGRNIALWRKHQQARKAVAMATLSLEDS